MSYAQLDVHFDEHPKYVALELEHFGLMACAISYCNRLLTDGVVPEKAVRGFGASGRGMKLAERLVAQGIWERRPDGFVVVGFLDHNPSREQVESKRQANRERQRRHTTKTSVIHSVTNGVPNALGDASLTEPHTHPLSQTDPLHPQAPHGGGDNPEPNHERPPLADPEFLTTFRSALASAGFGHKHVANGTWRDLSARWGTWTRDRLNHQEQHDLLRTAVNRWAKTGELEGARYPVSVFLTWAADQEGIGRPRLDLPEHQPVQVGYQLTDADRAAQVGTADALLGLLGDP